MRKSSRLWWLHGAILVSAVIGCKNCGSPGTSNGPGGAPPVATGSPYAGPTGAGSGMMYSQSGAGSMQGAGSMPGASSFPSSPAGGGYQMPNLSSGAGGGMR